MRIKPFCLVFGCVAVVLAPFAFAISCTAKKKTNELQSVVEKINKYNGGNLKFKAVGNDPQKLSSLEVQDYKTLKKFLPKDFLELIGKYEPIFKLDKTASKNGVVVGLLRFSDKNQSFETNSFEISGFKVPNLVLETSIVEEIEEPIAKDKPADSETAPNPKNDSTNVLDLDTVQTKASYEKIPEQEILKLRKILSAKTNSLALDKINIKNILKIISIDKINYQWSLLKEKLDDGFNLEVIDVDTKTLNSTKKFLVTLRFYKEGYANHYQTIVVNLESEHSMLEQSEQAEINEQLNLINDTVNCLETEKKPYEISSRNLNEIVDFYNYNWASSLYKGKFKKPYTAIVDFVEKETKKGKTSFYFKISLLKDSKKVAEKKVLVTGLVANDLDDADVIELLKIRDTITSDKKYSDLLNINAQNHLLFLGGPSAFLKAKLNEEYEIFTLKEINLRKIDEDKFMIIIYLYKNTSFIYSKDVIVYNDNPKAIPESLFIPNSEVEKVNKEVVSLNKSLAPIEISESNIEKIVSLKKMALQSSILNKELSADTKISIVNIEKNSEQNSSELLIRVKLQKNGYISSYIDVLITGLKNNPELV